MSYVKVQPFRGLCNQLGAICWAIGVSISYKHTGVWIDGMVQDAEDVRGKRIPASHFLDLEASSKAFGVSLVESLPPGAKVGRDLGLTKYNNGHLKNYVAKIVFAPSLREEAQKFIESRLSESYSAVHLRIEQDMLKHLSKVLRWKGNVRETLLTNYRTLLKGFPKDQALFVASNFGKTRRTVGKAIPATEGFETVQTPGPAGRLKNRDLRGAVDLLICVGASHFVGASFSSFSQVVVLIRQSLKKDSLFICG